MRRNFTGALFAALAIGLASCGGGTITAPPVTSPPPAGCGTATDITGLGGVWYPRSFDMTPYAGTKITLFIGVWKNINTTYYTFMYVGGVTLH